MSLAVMIGGYTNGECAAFEGVTAEDLSKYDLVNGPITMALEATDLLQEAWMEGIYAPNDLVMEAAMEGYTDVMESGKMDKIKEKLKSAGHKIAEAFRKLGDAIRAFFSKVAAKVKKKSSESMNAIKQSKKTEIEYNGYKYTHLDEIGKYIKDLTPEGIYGKVGVFKKAIAGDVKKDDKDIEQSTYKEQLDDALKDATKPFGVSDSGSPSSGGYTGALTKFWRNGETQTSEQKISTSEALKILSTGNKVYSNLDSVSAKIKKCYDEYAKKCEELSKRYEPSDDPEKKNDNADTEAVAVWHTIASYASKAQTFTNTVVSTWASAFGMAAANWESAVKKADDK